MPDQSPYWNPYLETLAPESGCGRLQLSQVSNRSWPGPGTVARPTTGGCYSARPGWSPGDIKTWGDVHRVPAGGQGHAQGRPARRSPFPTAAGCACPWTQVSEFRQTSGTTGTPVYQADSWQDWEWWAEAWCYILWSQGYRATDRVFIPFGYNIFVAFWAGHYAGREAGLRGGARRGAWTPRPGWASCGS